MQRDFSDIVDDLDKLGLMSREQAKELLAHTESYSTIESSCSADLSDAATQVLTSSGISEFQAKKVLAGESQQLLLGDDCSNRYGGRLASIQTPGGCGALRIGAEVIQRSSAGNRVWVSDPTWANHLPLLGARASPSRPTPITTWPGTGWISMA